ncbi:MAG: type II secretion system protein [Deltaproteobacteria bacterium]
MAPTKKRGEQEPRRIFQAMTYKPQAGMTLIEILIVVALIAAFTTFALPRLRSNLNLNLKKQARLLSGTVQFLYNQAAVKNQVYRLHYDLDNHKYWIESSTDKVFFKTEEDEKRNQRERKPPTAKFQIDTTTIKKPVQLEKKIRFKDIRTQAKSEPIRSGDAYTHFFPHGYAERSEIRLQSATGQVFTIVVNPLTGRAKVYDRDLEAKE